jgi:hypothetical protein
MLRLLDCHIVSTEGNGGTGGGEWEVEGGEDTTTWQQKTGWEFKLSVKKSLSPTLGRVNCVWPWVPSQRNGLIDRY